MARIGRHDNALNEAGFLQKVTLPLRGFVNPGLFGLRQQAWSIKNLSQHTQLGPMELRTCQTDRIRGVAAPATIDSKDRSQQINTPRLRASTGTLTVVSF